MTAPDAGRSEGARSDPDRDAEERLEPDVTAARKGWIGGTTLASSRRAVGTALGLCVALFSVAWLIADKATGKLSVILWATLCAAGFWMAAVSFWGKTRGTAVATSGTIVLGALAAFAQLLGSPPSVAPSPDAQRPSATPSLSTPRSTVPQELIGHWDGGSSGSTAGWYYKFSADGCVEHANGRIGFIEYGTVVVETGRMTLHFARKEPEVARWRVSYIKDLYGYSFTNLQLNGFTFVRQDAEPSPDPT